MDRETHLARYVDALGPLLSFDVEDEEVDDLWADLTGALDAA